MLILLFLNCFKENVHNDLFVSDEIFNAIIQCVKEERGEKRYFYVYTRRDTLFVLPVTRENSIFPIDRIGKIGAFSFEGSKIIIAESYQPKFEIIKENPKFESEFDSEKKIVGSYDEDIQYGYVYKISNPNKLYLIKKGKLKEFFIKP